MTTEPAPFHSPGTPDDPWWRHAVIYQVYPRSWADSTGDGVGDLPGITARLPYLVDLGVDALWLSPFYRSPMADAGYDVADYRDIDPLFGTLADADALIARAHELGLKVIVDLVPNHTSREHAWFQAALAAEPGSPERARYLFRDGRGPHGEEPPNDWSSVFTGSAWTMAEPAVVEDDGHGATRVVRKAQWYLNLFDSGQPDLDWTNPEVHEEFDAILRFWLDRGVDGFRVDVAHGLVKKEGLPDFADRADMAGTNPDGTATSDAPMWDQDGVHDIYRAWRRTLDEYVTRRPDGSIDPDGDRILVAEAWVEPIERAALYVRPDEMHQAFNFHYLNAPWRAADLREAVEESLHGNDLVGAPTTWVLSNHDVVRHASRLGFAPGTPRPNGIAADDPQPDAEAGLRRARAQTTLMLALPGSAYLYQGEELGLPEHTTLPDEARQDPTFLRSHGAETGRDGCRIPMSWEADAPAAGFNTTGEAWLPQPESYSGLAVDRQDGVEGSTLELYRALLRIRRERGLGSAGISAVPGTPDDVVAYDLQGADDDAPRTRVILNLGAEAVELPQGDVLVTSGPLDDGRLPTDTAAWVAPA
ncbi:glycoside hydrolase family 13 protein [Mobilicoccus pelagius]|uniref:Alpha-glucosidase n=1 Tax=Mobilicoccus pelagius NBRC 104925 TaxID=1089455 RepID=H5UVC4_9MICO|nr:glycoside hydrolase family 13 protein [Mobilicoccus pelagius]GAB49682.1 alpha-glucosidase [Mobilicoccus pelagius NBRC 104925]